MRSSWGIIRLTGGVSLLAGNTYGGTRTDGDLERAKAWRELQEVELSVDRGKEAVAAINAHLASASPPPGAVSS